MITVLLAFGLVYLGLHWWSKRSTRQMLEDFQVHFPGRCPICAYHRFGLQEGFVDIGSPLPPHYCPERKTQSGST